MLRRLSRWSCVIAAALLMTGVATAARAQDPGTIGDQPAATLLLPYFEVDLANPAGANTLFSVNNASASAALAHVTVWSELHVPVFVFDVYLTGFDVQTINVRDILNGRLPRTATAGQDPTDVLSPRGDYSQDINFAACNARLPYAAELPQSTIDHVRASLTGGTSPVTGLCAALPGSATAARGYITIDSVTACTDANPSTPGYFQSGGNGIADNRNILWGDVTHLNHLPGVESGITTPLVHIRAFPGATVTETLPSIPDTTVPGEYTFYGRLVSWTAADNREPLGTTFATRFVTGGDASTTLTVWRDPKVAQDPFSCGTTPSWYPLPQTNYAIFDEQEAYELIAKEPYPPPQEPTNVWLFPRGTQRVRVGTELPTTMTSGWMYLNLNHGGVNPPENPPAAQAWVQTQARTGQGRYGVGWTAAQLNTARKALSIIVGSY